MTKSLPERLLAKMRRGVVYNIKALAYQAKAEYRQTWTALARLEKRNLVKRVAHRGSGFRSRV